MSRRQIAPTVATVLAAETHEPRYFLVPSHDLPVIDLSKSLRAKLLSERADAAVFRFVRSFRKTLLLANLTSLALNSVVIVVKASIGQYLSLLSAVLGIIPCTASFSTLRYDIVRLMVHRFDFWFCFIISTLTGVMIQKFLGDLRALRIVVDWLGYLNIILIDGQVRGIRYMTFIIIVAIPPTFLMLVWMMLGRVDDAESFSIVEHETLNGSIQLHALDVIANGLITLIMLLAKIGYRKQKTLKWHRQHARIDCAIIRTRLKFALLSSPPRPRRLSAIASIVHSAISSPRAKSNRIIVPAAASGPRTATQQMILVNSGRVFDANKMLLPIKNAASVEILASVLPLLFTIGAIGLVLSCLIPLTKWMPESTGLATEEQLLVYSCVAVLCSATFTVTSVVLYQRELLWMLATSFDFAFYAFQVTSANISIAMLYEWNGSDTAVMLSWWIWMHWVLTLDALTPVMRTKLRLRIRYASAVVTLFLLGHIAVTLGILFVQNLSLRDVVVWRGTIWGSRVEISVLPFYFSRVVTLSLWCSRLIWWLSRAADDEVTVLRGSVSYRNYFANAAQDRSRRITGILPSTRRRQTLHIPRSPKSAAARNEAAVERSSPCGPALPAWAANSSAP